MCDNYDNNHNFLCYIGVARALECIVKQKPLEHNHLQGHREHVDMAVQRFSV
jgi:hypothetical protein